MLDHCYNKLNALSLRAAVCVTVAVLCAVLLAVTSFHHQPARFPPGNSISSRHLQLEAEPEESWLLPAPLHHRQRRAAHDDLDLQSDSTPHLMYLSPSDIRRQLQNVSKHNCSVVSHITNLTFLGSGWTKAVYHGTTTSTDLEFGHVAVKVVDRAGRDVRHCVSVKSSVTNSGRALQDSLLYENCLRDVEKKLLKEAYILNTINCQNIVKLLAVCVPGSDDRRQPLTSQLDHPPSHSSVTAGGAVTMVTELGEPVDIIRLLQTSWEERLKVCYGVTRLLYCLAHNSHGSVALNDFRRQQFVLVTRPLAAAAAATGGGGVEIKLSDVDDIGFDERSCEEDSECIEQLDYNNQTLSVNCVSGRCQGLNELKNIANAGRHFVSFLLSPGVPGSIRHLVNDIVDGFSGATRRTTSELLQLFERLVASYSNGDYLTEHRLNSPVATTVYKVVPSSDLPGLYDYRCRYSIAASTCSVTVFDVTEAQGLCDFDPQCRGFVLSNQTSWTGRHFVHLKNNISVPTTNPSTALYIKTTNYKLANDIKQTKQINL